MFIKKIQFNDEVNERGSSITEHNDQYSSCSLHENEMKKNDDIKLYEPTKLFSSTCLLSEFEDDTH